MREIKFRAWDNEENRFFPIGKLIWGTKGLEAFREDGWNIDKIYSCVIEQYIGLHDKNGKEIYEGDIVLTDWDSKTAVKWEVQSKHECWGHGEYGYEVNSGFSYSTYEENDIEVVGNIHENPELLK